MKLRLSLAPKSNSIISKLIREVINLVYVVVRTFYPTHKGEEVLKIYMELIKKYPPDDTIAETLIRGAGKPTENGSEGMSIYKLKEGKFDVLAKRIMSAMTMFGNIEGFGWAVELWATAEESMAAQAGQ